MDNRPDRHDRFNKALVANLAKGYDFVKAAKLADIEADTPSPDANKKKNDKSS